MPILTLSLHTEPLLKYILLQQYVQNSRVSAGIGMCWAQLLLKLQHLVHQVAEESIIIEQSQGIVGQFLMHQSKKPSAQLHLINTGSYTYVSDPQSTMLVIGM